jgi:hypothetical protein
MPVYNSGPIGLLLILLLRCFELLRNYYYRRVRPLSDRKVTILSVYLLVGRLVIISRKAVSKKRRKECIMYIRQAYPSC